MKWKGYLIHFIVFTVISGLLYYLIFCLWGDEDISLRRLAVWAVIYGTVVTIGKYLDDKGWDNWGKVLGLFWKK